MIILKEWIVLGSKQLSGSISVSGAKNSLLAILAGSIVTKSIVILENVTPLKDTYDMIGILKILNVRVIYDNKSKMIIDARNIKNIKLDSEEIKRIRASYYFMGALLSLFKDVSVIGPGGCNFASRPIDLHLFAFEKLGCKCVLKDDLYSFNKGKIKSRIINFKKVSVGATVNAILLSSRINGSVRLVNVAMEPEIDDLINFLNMCGASIKRDGNSIIIKGRKLHGCSYRIMDDRIEASTYLVLGACLGNNLKIMYKDSKYIMELINVLKDMNVTINVYDEYILVSKSSGFKSNKLIFDTYPKLATDIQQPLSIFMSLAKEYSILKDNIYPSRYTQIEDLKSMGFDMYVNNDCLYVRNNNNLKGGNVICKDLRGGVSLVIAALLINKQTRISNVYYIERGYYNLIDKLRGIGANIYEEN